MPPSTKSFYVETVRKRDPTKVRGGCANSDSWVSGTTGGLNRLGFLNSAECQCSAFLPVLPEHRVRIHAVPSCYA